MVRSLGGKRSSKVITSFREEGERGDDGRLERSVALLAPRSMSRVTRRGLIGNEKLRGKRRGQSENFFIHNSITFNFFYMTGREMAETLNSCLGLKSN